MICYVNENELDEANIYEKLVNLVSHKKIIQERFTGTFIYIHYTTKYSTKGGFISEL